MTPPSGVFDYATQEELDRLDEIDRLRDELTAERRKIWDRCRKRGERASDKRMAKETK